VTAWKTVAKDVQLRVWPRSLKNNLEDIEHGLPNGDRKKRARSLHQFFLMKRITPTIAGHQYHQENVAKTGYSPQKRG